MSTSRTKRYAVLTMGLHRLTCIVLLVVLGVAQRLVLQSSGLKVVPRTRGSVRQDESCGATVVGTIGGRMGSTLARGAVSAQTDGQERGSCIIVGRATKLGMRSRPLVTKASRTATKSVERSLYAEHGANVT